MPTDEDLARLAEQATNPGAFATPSPAPDAAPVVGTTEGPGVPPIANPEMPTAPVAPPQGASPPAGVPPVQGEPRPTAKLPGVDTMPLEQARTSADKLAEAQAGVGPLKSDALDAEAQSIGQESEAKRNAAVEMRAEEQAQKDGLAAAQKVANDAQEEVKNFKFPDYWGDKTSGQKVLAHIGYALGAYAAGGSSGNGVNYAAEKIKMISDQNYRDAKEKLGTKQWAAEQARKGVTDLQQQYKDDLSRLQMRQGMELQASADEAKAFLLQSKKPLSEAENNVLVQKLKSEGDAAYAKGFQDLVRDKAQLALEKARIGATYATIAESRREHDLQHDDRQDKALIDALKTSGNAGNAQAALRRERVAANIHEFNANAAKLKPGVITPEVLAKVQSNEAEIHAMSQPHGLMGALGANVARGVGIAAKSPYDGLTPEQTEAMRALDATMQHGAEMQPTTGAEVSHQWKETYRPRPSMDQASIDKALGNIKEMGKTFKSIIDPTNIGGRADVGSEKQGADSAPARTTPDVEKVRALSDADRRDAIQATAALRDPAKREKATRFLRHLGVM